MGLFDFGDFTSPGQPVNGGGGFDFSQLFNGGLGNASQGFGGIGSQMQPQYGGFDVQPFRNDSFSSMMSQMPQTQGFMEMLGQQPRREDYQPSTGRRIGGILAGLAGSFGGGNGAGITSSIVNQPFGNAVQDYQRELGNARQGAQFETGLAQLSRQFSQDNFQREQAGNELGLKRDQLTQQGALGNREIDVKQEALKNQQAQQVLDRALQERKISVDQYQAATGRINANTNVEQTKNQGDYQKAMLANKGQGTQPSAAFVDQRLDAAIRSDTVLSPYLLQNGEINFEAMKEDPMAMMKLRNVYQQLGLVPRPDIALR